MPLAKVEEAVVEVMLSTGRLRPVYKVEVPNDTKFADDWIEKRDPGEVVPTPTNPVFLSTQKSAPPDVDVPTANNALPPGVEEATYKGPANEDVAVVEVAMRLGRVVVP